jgi:hypothetical protein
MAHIAGELCWIIKRQRSGSTQSAPLTAQQLTAQNKPRVAGRFQKATQPARERKRKREEVDILQEKLNTIIVEHKTIVADLKSSSETTLHNLSTQLAEKDTIIRRLRAKTRVQNPTADPATEVPTAPVRKLLGGESRVTKKKLATVLQSFFDRRFEKEAQASALLAHFEQNPDLYQKVIAKIQVQERDLDSFLAVCESNPTWVNHIRREVVSEIEKFWTAEKCLSIQLHCKVGYSEKYQHLINLASKNYNKKEKKWEEKELFHPGSRVFVPKFKSKNQVLGLRTEIAADIPLIQDESGTACWLDLLALVEETVRQERKSGYL